MPELSQQAYSVNERSHLVEEPLYINVYFSPTDGQGLRIPVAKYRDGNYRIIPDRSVVGVDIIAWAESELANASAHLLQRSADDSQGPVDFQRSVEAFLYFFSKQNCVEKVSSHATSIRSVLYDHWLIEV